MKKVSKLKNTYKASYRYYKVMKEVGDKRSWFIVDARRR